MTSPRTWSKAALEELLEAALGGEGYRVEIASAEECRVVLADGVLRVRPRDDERPALARTATLDVSYRLEEQPPGAEAPVERGEQLAAALRAVEGDAPSPFVAPRPAKAGAAFAPEPPLARTLAILAVAAAAVTATFAYLVDDPAAIPPRAWAPAAGVVYAAVCWIVGDVFVFSRFGAYAKTGAREEGATLFVEADGAEASIADFDRIDGVPPGALRSARAVTSLTWEVEEAERWIATHPPAGGDAPAGPVRLVVGFDRWFARADGTFEHTREVVAEGSAWRRR